MEYLVPMTTHVPEGTPEQAVDDVRIREAAHSRDLATEDQLLRLWRHRCSAEIEAIVKALPLDP